MAQFKLEDKVRIFGLYMGAEYLYKSGERNVLLSNNVSFMGGYTYEHIKHFDARLILKPLNTITDEHVVELFKNYFDMPFLGKNAKRFWEITRNKNEEGLIEMRSPYNEFSFTFDTDDASLVSYRESNLDTYWSNVQALDYLREQGYAVPYKGIDLFKSGIAVKPK